MVKTVLNISFLLFFAFIGKFQNSQNIKLESIIVRWFLCTQTSFQDLLYIDYLNCRLSFKQTIWH